MMESFAWVYQDKKTGKNRSGQGLITYVVLYLAIFGIVGSVFYETANMLCAPLLEANLGWLYFALMGMVGALFGTFGSVFSTYTTLYQAKDNDSLFAMPIPANHILIARLTGVYAMGLLYELLVMVPVIIVYFLYPPLQFLDGMYYICKDIMTEAPGGIELRPILFCVSFAFLLTSLFQ